jgi:hypothetical protein
VCREKTKKGKKRGREQRPTREQLEREKGERSFFGERLERARGREFKIARASKKKSKQERSSVLAVLHIYYEGEKKFGPHKNKTHPRARAFISLKKKRTTTTTTITSDKDAK